MATRNIRVLGFYTFDRYILFAFVKNFILSLFVFLAMYFFANMLTELPTLLKKVDSNNPNITVANVFTNYFLKIPSFFSTVFPFAYLFSTSYILGNYYKNNEIVSMITAGWSMRRITFMVVSFGFVCSLMMMVLNFSIIPNFNHKSSKMEELLYRETKGEDQSNIQTYGEGGIQYYARYYNNRNMLFASIMLVKSRTNAKSVSFSKMPDFNFENIDKMDVQAQINKISEINAEDKLVFPYEWIIRAEQLSWDKGLKNWKIKDGFKWIFDENGNVTKHEVLADTAIVLKETPDYFSKETREIKEMSREETLEYIEKLRKERKSFQGELVDFYSEKYGKPFSVFILAILASALGRFFSRKHLLVMTIVSSFVIAAVYFIILEIGVSLGKSGTLPPLVAAYAGNIVCIGIYFYIKRKQLT
ncbi:MAG: hypothetical protein CVV50_02485 [Spirochaetae bacterium HGW-Spirochaetae-6]|nr:MAG: hypothetical protein CVV50_02485 [Spirochaetae bacterium HGW-Spirochaetae-6]